MVKIDQLPTIASSAVLGSISISVFTGRKKDKATEAEVKESKGARSSRAASVHKNLFADCPQLDAIIAHAAKARLWFNSVTLPWNDNGMRLIPTSYYFEIANDAKTYEAEFTRLVNAFLKVYATEVSKQAFALGTMFDRTEYPDVTHVGSKFAFAISIQPVPLAGDFRVDTNNETIAALQEQYEVDAQRRIKDAMADAWNRVRESVEHIRDRMEAVIEYEPGAEQVTDPDTGEVKIIKTRRPKLHDSMVDKGLELCSVLSHLNVTNDPALEEVRKDLERALVHVDMKSLKESPEMQQSTKSKMEEILAKMNGA